MEDFDKLIDEEIEKLTIVEGFHDKHTFDIEDITTGEYLMNVCTMDDAKYYMLKIAQKRVQARKILENSNGFYISGNSTVQ